MHRNVVPTKKSGSELFHVRGVPESFGILDFWASAFSCLLTNMNRGVLAEYLVLKALGLTDVVMNDYEAYDALTSDGKRIEIKSSAYVQRWPQRKLSDIRFSVRRTRIYDYNLFDFVGEPARHSDIYVFALLTHQDKGTVDPLDLSQWTFYVVPTSTVNRVIGTGDSVSLPTLVSKLAPIQTDYFGLRAAISNVSLEATNVR
jgi:hypothetical protein